MGSEKVTRSRLGNLWRSSHKRVEGEPPIGILAFEAARLMSEVVSLWQCVSDKQIIRLREEIVKSIGIRKLVSEDDEYIMNLALSEIIQNLVCVTKSVARFGKRCKRPVYRHLDHAFDDPIGLDLNWWGWEYRTKKMERKVKKMQRFVAVTGQLYQELQVLAEIERGLGRVVGSVDRGQVKSSGFQEQVMRQQQAVNSLREMSPWVRTYDYTVRLLLRSLFTIMKRIKSEFGANQLASVGKISNSDRLPRSHSISTLVHSASEDSRSRVSSRSLTGRSVSNLGASGHNIRASDMQGRAASHHSSADCRKPIQLKSNHFARVGSLRGCMIAGSHSPSRLQSSMPTSNGYLKPSDIDKKKDNNMVLLSRGDRIDIKASHFNFKHKLLNASSSTLGAAALAVHYSHVVIMIERLSLSPQWISPDARDDLYNMLPASIRATLRAKLKLFGNTSAFCVYDAALVKEWSLILARMLEWLAPLAHNMIRWHSERNFENQPTSSGKTVLLVQTLYHANQAKAEAAITELLIGLTYLSRFGRKPDAS